MIFFWPIIAGLATNLLPKLLGLIKNPTVRNVVSAAAPVILETVGNRLTGSRPGEANAPEFEDEFEEDEFEEEDDVFEEDEFEELEEEDEFEPLAPGPSAPQRRPAPVPIRAAVQPGVGAILTGAAFLPRLGMGRGPGAREPL